MLMPHTRFMRTTRNAKTKPCVKHDWVAAGYDKCKCAVCGKPSTFTRVSHALRMAAQQRAIRNSNAGE